MNTPPPPWSPPPGHPTLAGDEIHVWCASLRRPAEEVARLTAVLSAEERERGERFLSVPARNQFLVARGLLRLLLGRYLDSEPTRLTFRHGPAGKPALPGGGLHFNVSHSHELVVYAFTRRAEVGVDVEHVRPVVNEMELAERFFSPAEAAALRALEGERRREAFFRLWTCKEAYLKANGQGIAHGLERVEFSVHPEEPARMLRVDGEEEPARQWSLRGLAPAAGYVGALALACHDYRLTCWRWPDE